MRVQPPSPIKKAKKKAKNKTATHSKVEFKNKRTPTTVDDLRDLERQQLVVCGRLYDGEIWPAERRLQEVDEPEEGNFYDGRVEIWDVYVDGVHEYDAWMYLVDSGAVLERGTTKPVLSRIQFDFAAGGGDPLLASLVEAAYEEISK